MKSEIEKCFEKEFGRVVRLNMEQHNYEYRKLMEMAAVAGEVEQPPEIKPSTSKPFICHKHG